MRFLCCKKKLNKINTSFQLDTDINTEYKLNIITKLNSYSKNNQINKFINISAFAQPDLYYNGWIFRCKLCNNMTLNFRVYNINILYICKKCINKYDNYKLQYNNMKYCNNIYDIYKNYITIDLDNIYINISALHIKSNNMSMTKQYSNNLYKCHHCYIYTQYYIIYDNIYIIYICKKCKNNYSNKYINIALHKYCKTTLYNQLSL